eukprot:TRINITY_DN18897_c0_g1_i7.p2 TRINITY_DN18897_c0_g1~~TRINITY_DN18897_c0_g1_i7.p2  ORF type:complete len:145 (+),score=11.56 TRINITY_DN18897_c0_g1_i7:335-769(+)
MSSTSRGTRTPTRMARRGSRSPRISRWKTADPPCDSPMALGRQALELTCNGDRKRPDQGLAQYGVKAVNGRNRLSGPGLESSDKPGILMGGSKWPGRLANRCGELLGEHGEEEIYGVYARGEDLFGLVCAEDCAAEIEGHQQEL